MLTVAIQSIHVRVFRFLAWTCNASLVMAAAATIWMYFKRASSASAVTAIDFAERQKKSNRLRKYSFAHAPVASCNTDVLFDRFRCLNRWLNKLTVFRNLAGILDISGASSAEAVAIVEMKSASSLEAYCNRYQNI